MWHLLTIYSKQSIKNAFSHIIGDVLLKPITECAGKDISHWFDPKTKDVSYCNTQNSRQNLMKIYLNILYIGKNKNCKENNSYRAHTKIFHNSIFL